MYNVARVAGNEILIDPRAVMLENMEAIARIRAGAKRRGRPVFGASPLAARCYALDEGAGDGGARFVENVGFRDRLPFW